MEDILMDNLKSHTEYLLGLCSSFIREDMVRTYNDTSFLGDALHLEKCVANQGVQYLTKVLPRLGAAFDAALQTFVFKLPSEFKRKKNTVLPLFLNGLFRRIFDVNGGLKPDFDMSCVRDLRQICYFAKKYEGVRYDPETIENFVRDYEVLDKTLQFSPEWKTSKDVLSMASNLLYCVFGDHRDFSDVRPKHGPGSVAERIRPNEKMVFHTRYVRVEKFYPSYKYDFANAFDLLIRKKSYLAMDYRSNPIARIAVVPKDSKGPRIISMEPQSLMWRQQGLARKIVQIIEQSPFTKGHVNFTSQEVNRRLAVKGSALRCAVTLDMKEASDRISVRLVKKLFKFTNLTKYLLALRSSHNKWKEKTFSLRKFAPMGSALTFPVESIIHWALATASLYCSGVPFDRALKAVFVYGDDIIIENENHAVLYDTFPKFGLRFNKEKSCTRGIFRESCGMDAVSGCNVTPIKIRKSAPMKSTDTAGLIATISLCDQLFAFGYYSAAQFVKTHLDKIFGYIPNAVGGSGTIGYAPVRYSKFRKERIRPIRWNSQLQKLEILMPTVLDRKIKVSMGSEEYFRSLLIWSEDFMAGKYTLVSSIRRKLAWVSTR
jgi:hypothetical protein